MSDVQIADFGMSIELQDENYYTSHINKIPLKWTAPEVSPSQIRNIVQADHGGNIPTPETEEIFIAYISSATDRQ